MTIYALAGRRPDPPNTETKRFPLAVRDLVAERIGELFAKHQATALVCSAACGADLIALDVAGDLNLHRRIVLPFGQKKFRKTSVTDRPGNWGQLYDRIIEEVDAAGDLVVMALTGEGGDAYRRANEAIIEQAANMAIGKVAVRICLVWEGTPRGPDDITFQLAEAARSRGWPVDEILTI